jgi:hypothetical protein
MATGTAATAARQYATQQVHYLRKSIVYGDNGVARTVGIIPAGSLILKPASGVHITTVFNAGTTNTLNVGSSADDDLFGTLLALGTANFVPLDENIGGFLVAADTTITATVVLTGTAATTGAGEVVIAYIPDNDG